MRGGLVLCCALSVGVGLVEEPIVRAESQPIAGATGEASIGRLAVNGFPHLAATPDNIADCSGFHRVLSEERIEIGPVDARSFYDRTASHLSSAAERLTYSSQPHDFDEMADQSASRHRKAWLVSEGQPAQRVEVLGAMITQYYGCLGMIDDLIGAGIISQQ